MITYIVITQLKRTTTIQLLLLLALMTDVEEGEIQVNTTVNQTNFNTQITTIPDL